MSREIEEKERVCVTGAGGYVASWVVKFLLSKGYMVHATVRDPCDEKKNGHLKKLENASDSLQLFKTDLLDYEGLCAAIAGCTGVFHVACPLPGGTTVANPEAEMLEPAITGTRYVLNACLDAKVKKVVMVSSLAAVAFNPSWPKEVPMDEESWSDPEYCKKLEQWYSLGKTVSEMEAMEFGRKNGLNIVTVCPSLVVGPMLQSTLNASSLFLLNHLKGLLNPDTGYEVEDQDRPIVDVRDVAEAILLAYEKPEAEGRYICSSYAIRDLALVEKIKATYVNYDCPKNFTKREEYKIKFSSDKLEKLGWKYKPLGETIVDAVKNFEELGLVGKT